MLKTLTPTTSEAEDLTANAACDGLTANTACDGLTYPHSGKVIISLNGLIQVHLDPTPGRRVPTSRKRLITLNLYRLDLANYIQPGHTLTWHSQVKNYATSTLLGGIETSPIDVKVTLPSNGTATLTLSTEALNLWQPNQA